LQTNDKSIWNEIYEKEKFTPGWVYPGTDRNLLRLIGNYLKKNKNVLPSLLDIGCGNGRNSNIVESLPEHKIKYTGADFAEKVLEYCRSTYTGKKEFVYADMTAPSLPLEKSYQMIIDSGCFHAIEPAKRKSYIDNLYKLSQPDSLIILAFWYRTEKTPDTDTPAYFPYLYLDEWFFNCKDIETIFSDQFTVEDFFVDKDLYPGINNGFAYAVLEKN